VFWDGDVVECSRAIGALPCLRWCAGTGRSALRCASAAVPEAAGNLVRRGRAGAAKGDVHRGKARSTAGAALLACLVLVATACDPGYEFRVRNPCDTSIRVVFLDSNEFSLSPLEESRLPTKIPARSDRRWSTIDPDIEPPFGVYLVDGPRAGEILKAPNPDITIPRSACR
jgi:hypothetical protein